MWKWVLIMLIVSGGAAEVGAKPARKGKAAVAPVAKASIEAQAPAVAVAKPLPAPTPAPTPPPKLSYDKNSPADQKPYWSSKPELLKRMLDDRYITVSAKRDDAPNGHAVFTLAGAGVVNRGKEGCFTLAQQYPQLKDVSDHFKTVTFDEKQEKLFVLVDALGYQARMLMHIVPVSTPERSELQWEVVWGSFKGMKGVIGFETLSARQTEVSFQGHFEAPELPIPKFIMGFAIEVVTQKVAERMRTYLEEHIP